MRKSFFTMLLTVAMVLGIVATSSADPWKDEARGKFKFNKGHGKWKAVQLNDVNKHWAEQQIRTMSSYGIILGYPDLTFRPNVPVTKYEAVMMIARASGFTGTFDSDRSWGDDVPSWMTDCLDFAVDEGILTEDEAGDINGLAPAKRYEVAVWANRALGLEQDSEFSFQDLDKIPYFARPFVGGMFKCGYMVGYPGNFFQPNKPVTRAEMATVLYRILAQDVLNGGDDENEDNDTGEALEIDSLQPMDGSDDVDEDTDELVVRFNLEVQPVDDLDGVLDGITVRSATYDEEVDIDEVTIEGETLTIELDESLARDNTYRVTIEDDLIEAKDSGENFDGISGSGWEFSTGESFGIVRLSPEDGADDVDGDDTQVLKAEFSDDIRVISGKSLFDAVEVYNRSDDQEVEIDEVEIDGDTLVITLEDPLEDGDTFEVTIEADYFEEEDTGDNFEGIEGNDWRFATR